jgi:hypothetical protein
MSVRGYKYAPHIFVLFASTSYSLYVLSWKFINPFSYRWIYGSQLANRDDSGHAIGALFYLQEPFSWPLGKFTSFGGSVGPSVVYWAISPIFAIPAKVLVHLHLLNTNFQFIGLQVLIGFVLTPLALFVFSRRLGSDLWPSIVVSLSILLFPTLLGHWANESLASQFIVIAGLFLALQPKASTFRNIQWGVLSLIAVGTNSYFVPMVLLLCFTEFVALQKSVRKRLSRNIRSLFLSIITVMIFQWIFGGFLLSTLQLGTGAGGLSTFSGNLFSLIDSRQYGLLGGIPAESWEGFNYLGLASIICIILYFLYRSRFDSAAPEIFRGPQLKLVITLSVALYLYSLGPDIKIGSIYHFNFINSIPSWLVNAFSIFRALGRFQWCLYYLLLGVSALGLTYLVQHLSSINSRVSQKTWAWIACSTFVGINLLDMHYLDSAIRSQVHSVSVSQPAEDEVLQREFDESNGIKVVPAYDGNSGGLLPWRYLSEYALRAGVDFKSFGFYARYDYSMAGKIQSQEFGSFIGCKWDPDTLYLVQSGILEKVKCDFEVKSVYASGPWRLVKKN